MSHRSTQRDVEFDEAIEAFVSDLELDKEASPEKLLLEFPERATQIERLLRAVRDELHACPQEALPPFPDKIESGDPKTLIANPSHLAKSPQPVIRVSDSRIDTLPMQLGAYKLIEKIGQGGMGEVYRAAQERPIQREVAIKIVRPEIGGRELLLRFDNERRSLAKMNHPNIATVLDGGATEDGRPYLVMELVNGVGLTEYCNSNQLDIRQRLAMMLKVCAGVQHAHQKGIIHRDIKPSNILVSEFDHEPIPKVIDFGLAKAFTEVDGLESSHTQLGQILGTLQYMSPEQASLQADRVDTRSDIFSLGVLLFELLTGTTPLEHNLSADSPVDERLRRVRQQEPARPSDRMRKTSRFSTDSKISGSNWGAAQLRGDLDAICMKAMASDPAQRYDTVAALAEDISRYLGNRPVLAAAPSELYLIFKYVLRHRVAVGMTALVTALLIVGTAVSSYLAIVATRAETVAEQRNRDLLVARDRAEANLYVAHMNLVQQAISEGDLQQARGYLRRHIPSDGQDDLRGFEWHYWNRRLQRYLGECDTKQEAMGIAYAPSGEFVVSCGGNGKVQFWDPKQRRLLRQFQAGRDYIGSAVVSSSEQYLATACRDGLVKIWDLENNDRLLHACEHDEMMRCVAFDNANALLFAGGTSGLIHVSDVESGNPVAEFQGHEHDVYALAVSPDNRWLASAGGDYLVKIWDLRSRECVRTLEGHRGRARAVAFSPDGSLLVSGSYDGTAIIWDLSNGETLHHLANHTEQVYGVAFAPDGKTLASCSRDESIRIWDVTSGQEIETILGNRFTVYAIAYSPDGSQLVSAAHDKTIKFWNVENRMELTTFDSHSDAIRDIAFSQDQALLASAGDDETILVRNVRTGEIINEFASNHGEATAITFLGTENSNSVERLLAGYEDGTLITFAVPSGDQIAEFAGHDDYVFCIAISPDQDQVATVSADRMVKLWDATTLELVHTFSEHTDQILAVAYSPDGKTLASAGDAELIAWDLESLNSVYRISGNGYRIGCTSFSADGKYLGYSGRDRKIHICDSKTGTQLMQLKGHSASVHAIQFDPDGRTVMSGGTDMQLKFWDLSTGEVKTSLLGHRLPIMMLRLSPDGQVLASAGGDGIVRLWYR